MPENAVNTSAHKPVVLLAETLSPATVDALGPDFDVRSVDGTDRAALFAALADADAVLIRSATKIDAEALSHAPVLKVVARAGVGLDNVDIKAATAAGVMVVNAPTSNIVSAAELTVGHVLSLARRIPAAHGSLSAGEWKRSSYTGVELFEKTVGIVGLGRIGALVAARLAAFDMRVVAYDPYVTSARAQQLGVQLVSLEELVAEADFLTIHMPKTPETTGMIGAEQFRAMKPTAYVVNVARGGLIDEDALLVALQNGEIAGAGLDVFTSEPPVEGSTARALTALPNVVVTPHLGASTDEAQEKAGVSVARSVRLALGGDLVPDAVNVAGGLIDPYVRPGIPLTEKLGQILSALAQSPLTSLDVEVHGELNGYDVSVLRLAALKGVFTPIVSETVSYVNAPLLAEQRGVAVRLVQDDVSEEYRNVITLRGALSDRPEADREARRDQRPRRRVAHREEPRRHALHRPPWHRRGLRTALRGGRHQHRRHADRPRDRRWAGAVGADARLADPRRAAGRGARSHRRGSVPADRARRRLSAGPSPTNRRPRRKGGGSSSLSLRRCAGRAREGRPDPLPTARSRRRRRRRPRC